ncbi:MAG TPA: hypothetical protein VLG40_05460 [Candidatus Saccharimonas sp.]|nr:hypothetical protein [Candidatus Saccharimonas sp.]
MEPTTQQNTLRSISVYVLIGALLLAAVILGVRWAKARSDGYAKAAQAPTAQQTAGNNSSSQSQPSQSQPQTGNKPTTPSQPSPTEQNKAPQVAVNPQPAPVAAAQNPQRMPSTGIEDAFLPIGSLIAVVFAALTYVQSRRRLLRI